MKRRQMPKQVPKLGASDSEKFRSKRDRPPAMDLQDPCRDMLIKLGDNERRRNLLSNLTFLVITVVPWVALIWLI